MDDSYVPSKRILRPHFSPGGGGLSSASSSHGQVKIKKHKLFSTVTRTYTLPTATLSTTSVKKEQPKKLFSIFTSQTSKGRQTIPTLTPLDSLDHGNKPPPPPKTIFQLMQQPKNLVHSKSTTIPPSERVMPSSIPPQLTSSTIVNEKRQAVSAPWPDQTIFNGGHIRQSSATAINNSTANNNNIPIPTRIPEHQMETILKTRGKAYLDLIKQKRLSHRQQQQPSTTALLITHDNDRPYDLEDIIHRMNRLYPSGWRSPACQTLLSRRDDMKEDDQWCDKYRPDHVDALLDNQTRHHYLRNWLEQQKVTTMSPSKKKKKEKDLNMMLLVGPHGVGKTAGVFTAAQETGYRVFEIHPGLRRSLKDVMRLVGDMTKNHLVRFDGDTTTTTTPQQQQQQQKDAFFTESQEILHDGVTHYGQSLVLLEEVDLVYQSDKGFWNAVCDLARSSKRPIILTCNDTSVIPFHMLSFQAVIRYQVPRLDLLLPYLHLICFLEGFDISRTELKGWVNKIGLDLRQLLMTLEYLHHQPYTLSRPITTHNGNTSPMLQAHMDVLIKQVVPPWLCKSDRIPGTQVTPLCMQLVENDTKSQTGVNGSEDDLDLFTTLQVWLNNRSLIDAGVGMTEKRISQVYGLDGYYGDNEEDHECGYLHSWKTPEDWDHQDTEAHMEATLMEWNHPQKGTGMVDIMAWQHICDQRHKQKEDSLLFVLPLLNSSYNSFGVWRRYTFLDISHVEQLESLRQGRNRNRNRNRTRRDLTP